MKTEFKQEKLTTATPIIYDSLYQAMLYMTKKNLWKLWNKGYEIVKVDEGYIIKEKE